MKMQMIYRFKYLVQVLVHQLFSFDVPAHSTLPYA